MNNSLVELDLLRLMHHKLLILFCLEVPEVDTSESIYHPGKDKSASKTTYLAKNIA